jgi:hypothetical protein
MNGERKMTLKERIAWHREQERVSAQLAANYVKDKNWIIAADSYRAASYHQAIHRALKEKQ